MTERTLWKERVVISQGIHHGEPCIKNTRVPVATIIGSLADGLANEEILRQYPQLGLEDIRAALEYAAEVLRHDLILPLAS